MKKAAEAKAKDIADQVRKNPKSFAEIAKKESQDPGWRRAATSASRARCDGEAFEEAAFAAKKGEIVAWESDFGYHVIS